MYFKNNKKVQLQEKTTLNFGTLHWVNQLTPPSLLSFLMLFLFFIKDGPMIWFGMSVVIGAGLISVLSALFFLVTFKKNKYFLVRPLFTILIATILFPLANYTATDAKEKTHILAKRIEAECKLNNKCPQFISSKVVGGLVNYPLRYENIDNKKFSLYFYRQFGHGTWFKSGIDESLKITSQ